MCMHAQLATLKTPRKTCPGKANKNFQTKLSEHFYRRTIFSENFYPRMKIFRKFTEIFCPMWSRTNFIWIKQKFSENYCPRTKFL